MLINLFLIGLAITLEPLQNVAMILILSTERGIMKGIGFIGGWLGSLTIIVAVVELILDGKPLKTNSLPSTGALAFRYCSSPGPWSPPAWPR